ncbi:MAG: CPBP family intramembrane glutamic endopeptidase [Bacteroidota bacterium]
MLENTSTPGKAVLFFITRLFILAGMVLFFSSVSYLMGVYLCKLLFGFDLLTNPELMNAYGTDPYVLNALKMLQVIVSIGAMLVPAWLFPKALEQTPKQFLQLTAKPNRIFWLICILMILVNIPLISWLVEINEQFRLPESMAALEAQLKSAEEAANRMTKAFLSGTSVTDLGINIFIVALVPAVAEELLFRGALQRFIKFCFGNTHAAVLSAAIIFSAFHGQVYGFLPRMVLGMLLGYIFAYSGSLWPAVWVHFMNNAISVIIGHYKLEETGWALFNESYHFPVYAILLSAVACVSLVYLMYRNQQQQPFEHGT